MADPICRWRNTTIKQIVEFTNILPHSPMPKKEAHDYIENRWTNWDGSSNFFKTAYQLAAQLALYYEDETSLYPRFDHAVSMEEASAYLDAWFPKYYVPNPYTGSFSKDLKPIVLNEALYEDAGDEQGVSLDEFFSKHFNVDLGNKDILTNLLNQFSNLTVANGIAKRKDGIYNVEHIVAPDNSLDKKTFFEWFGVPSYSANYAGDRSTNKGSLQTIYYGAPGTGKSHTIQQMTNDDNSVRITFHPDSDYASFVGAYKPTMSEVPVFVPFGNTVTEAIDGQGKPVKEKKIQYEFIPQAFLTAYVEAWKRMAQGAKTESPAEDYYLVIEEINRGNCAQIFGDLFQLLDRNADGFSSYSIKPDKDIQKFLASSEDGFANKEDFPEGSIPEKIRTGQQMLLPPNLHIWATMNTSDQSLFPIDSAFKRRWDWVYIPISKGIDKTTGKEIDWVVRACGIDWDWWSFLEKINPVIYSATQSEDKKLGFFFARATGGVISADQFVGKVIFYIWNDVFKDFGLDHDEFKDHKAQNGDNDRLTFDKFFMPDGSPNEETVVTLMENLGVEKVTDKEGAKAEDTEEAE